MEEKDRAAHLKTFAHTLEQLSDIAAQLTNAEQAKMEAASAGKHEKMDSFLKEEQALLLKLKGLEQQRMHQAGELGWKDLTFRDILEKAGEEESVALSPLFAKLSQQLQKLSETKDSADRIIMVRLREFEHILGSAKPDVPSRFQDRYV